MIAADRLKGIGRQVRQSDFARHVLKLGGGNVLAQLMLLASGPFLARLYAPDAFGVFAIYSAVFAALTLFATLQYEAALLLPRYHRQAVCLLILILVFCPVAALTVGIPIVIFRDSVATLLGVPALADWLWLLPISIMLIGWYQALRYWTMRREAFGDVARNAVVRTALGAGSALAMGVWQPFPEAPEAGLILSHVIGETVGNLLLAFRVLQRDRDVLFWPGGRRFLAMARRWRRFALMLVPSQGVAMCYGHLPVVAIGFLFGATAAGHYAWAERFAVAPALLVAAAIGDVYRQRATVDYHRHGRFDRLMRRTLAVTTALAAPPYIIGIMIAPWLFSWLFGAAWVEAGVLAQILMVGGLVSFVIKPVDHATIICEKTGFIFCWQLARLLLKLTSVGLVAALDGSLHMLIWMIVIARIGLYLIDVAYCYHLAKGGSPNRPRSSSPMAPPST